MCSKTSLKIDWCSHEAAKYAVEHWHYSKRMPKSKLAKLGVWEDGKFIGAVVFGVGATSDLVKPYGLTPTQGCELVRVALKGHKTPVSRIVSICIRLIKRAFSGLRLIVSFADPEYRHLGGIYQAGGWIYTGITTSSAEYLVHGKRWHGRALRHEKPEHLTTKQTLLRMDPEYRIIAGSIKYRYLMPLDDEIRQQIEPLRKPYPKRETCAGSISSDAPGIHPGEGGAEPTSALTEEL